MKRLSLITAMAIATIAAFAQEKKQITSPDGRLTVTLYNEGGLAQYDVNYDGKQMLTRSSLGLRTNVGDFSKELKLVSVSEKSTEESYQIRTSKRKDVSRKSNDVSLKFENEQGNAMVVDFSVSDNDIAFRYTLQSPKKGNPKCAVVYSEATAFKFPSHTTTFLTPQALPMAGWERTKPAYEERYTLDAPLDKHSPGGVGYTFPALFHIGSNGWVLVSETGLSGDYCGARLGEWKSDTGYTVEYPQKGENNGFGSEWAQIALPGSTPWRTITAGKTLKPIVETTVFTDVVKPLYDARYDYKPGRYTWSWLIWQDSATVYDDQLQFIDLAAKMGYEYCLVDALWDTQIGYDKIEKLAAYAKSKGVGLMLWYNSNGSWNDAPQGPRGVINNPVKRKKDMAWMQRIGVKGIKADFFAGDKQETIKLYEQILSDANDYGLQVIFHGCTLQRGWERMYPNYAGSEAAMASENVYFDNNFAKDEAQVLTTYPFTRNAVGSFDWGGVMMNRFMSRDNKSRHRRYTSDTFEMATAITNQCSVNCIAMQPNNTEELDSHVLDFLRNIPTTWEDTKFIDGYPAKYVVIARKHNGRWYVGGLNATDKPLKLRLNLDMISGKAVKYYTDNSLRKGETFLTPVMNKANVKKDGSFNVTIQPNGGIVIEEL